MSLSVDTAMDALSTSDAAFCRFCSAVSREEVLLSSERTNAFASVGAYIEGWTLVVPRTHVFALADLDTDEWRDFAALTGKVRARIEAVYGSTVMFEHGAAGSARTAGCGVDHAHLHILPWATDLRSEIARTPDLPGFEWDQAGTRPRGKSGQDYIWLSDSSGSWITHAPELPSQVVRRALANALAIDEWDWKADHRLAVLAATNSKLRVK